MEHALLKEFQEENLTLDDIERSVRYAKDLTHGLATIREYPQGVTVFGSARLNEDNEFYKKAYELGRKLAAHDHPVITGGGPGIMEAANRGAFEHGGRSIGLNIHLSTEQDLNKYTTDSMEFRYFFARKVMLTFSSAVYVFFPGGFGTLDEFSEVLELRHTAKIPPAPLFLFGSEFWKGLDEWIAGKMCEWILIETGSGDTMNEMKTGAADQNIVKNARELYTITDDIDEIVAKTNEIEGSSIADVVDRIVNQYNQGHDREGRLF
jgi:uncharacterized protein (TIGR00730 family)